MNRRSRPEVIVVIDPKTNAREEIAILKEDNAENEEDVEEEVDE